MSERPKNRVLQGQGFTHAVFLMAWYKMVHRILYPHIALWLLLQNNNASRGDLAHITNKPRYTVNVSQFDKQRKYFQKPILNGPEALNKAPTSVQTSTLGAEFVSLKSAVEHTEMIRYYPRTMGVKVTKATTILCDIKGMVINSKVPQKYHEYENDRLSIPLCPGTSGKQYGEYLFHPTRGKISRRIYQGTWQYRFQWFLLWDYG